MGDRLIFQLGTNNWQRGGEFAPGSGILHEAHHHAYNALPGLHDYSMYPSKVQRFHEEDVRVFELDHDIPIAESVSPTSSYRWHSMSEAEVTAYRERLTDRYISVLTALIELHAKAGEHAQQVDVARELVDLDPLNEEGHRALIAAYARSGRRGHALRQYMECRRALVDQLGIDPERATTALQARILAGEPV